MINYLLSLEGWKVRVQKRKLEKAFPYKYNTTLWSLLNVIYRSKSKAQKYEVIKLELRNQSLFCFYNRWTWLKIDFMHRRYWSLSLFMPGLTLLLAGLDLIFPIQPTFDRSSSYCPIRKIWHKNLATCNGSQFFPLWSHYFKSHYPVTAYLVDLFISCLQCSTVDCFMR